VPNTVHFPRGESKMPKSKRNKLVSLTKTKKKGKLIKDKLIDSVRESAANYSSVYLFEPENMRNNSLKAVRTAWSDSRFFLGKNKVMAHALGDSAASECQDNIFPLARRLVGDCGLLFTNRKKSEVVKYFSNYSELSYARSGFQATEDFKLEKGPLTLPFPIEPRLRKLGLNTKLDEGVIQLLAPTAVCKEGDILTPEQCDLLELFEVKMSYFRLNLVCMWSGGEFFEFDNGEDDTME